jgi:hypothetical protein
MTRTTADSSPADRQSKRTRFQRIDSGADLRGMAQIGLRPAGVAGSVSGSAAKVPLRASRCVPDIELLASVLAPRTGGGLSPFSGGRREVLPDKRHLVIDNGGRLEHLQGFLSTPRDAAGQVERWRAG